MLEGIVALESGSNTIYISDVILCTLIFVMWIRCRGLLMSRDELKMLICIKQE